MCVCVGGGGRMWWVYVCVCVSHMVQWYVQSISDREVAGSIPDDYGRTRLSSLSRTLPDSSFILLGGYQQPLYAEVCGVVCVEKKKKKWKNGKRIIGIHWPGKVTSISCVVDTRLNIVAVNSSALKAVEWCNPSTSCYV